MTTKTLVLCTLFCLLGFNQLQATIEIISITARTGRGCNGAIEIRADGTAGPFSIYVEDDDEYFFQDEIDGTFSFSGLCGGDYDPHFQKALDFGGSNYVASAYRGKLSGRCSAKVGG